MHPPRTSGFVTLLLLLITPIILLLGTLLFDFGRSYQRHQELQRIGQSGLQDGLLLVAQTLRQRALENYHQTCATALPPDSCEDPDWADFLSPLEVQQIVFDPEHQEDIHRRIVRFIKTHDPKHRLSENHLKIHYPYDFSVTDSSLSIALGITEPPSSFWGLFSPSWTLSVQRLVTLPLFS